MRATSTSTSSGIASFPRSAKLRSTLTSSASYAERPCSAGSRSSPASVSASHELGCDPGGLDQLVAVVGGLLGTDEEPGERARVVALEQGADGGEREAARLQGPDALEPLEVLGAEAAGAPVALAARAAGPHAGSSGSCRPRSRPVGPARRCASRSRRKTSMRRPSGDGVEPRGEGSGSPRHPATPEFDKDYSGVDTLNVHTSRVGSGPERAPVFSAPCRIPGKRRSIDPCPPPLDKGRCAFAARTGDHGWPARRARA